MKNTYILVLIILVSCVQNTKEKKVPVTKAQDLVEDAGEIIQNEPQQNDIIGFNKVISTIKTKELPLVDTTNFDSFIDEFKLYNKEEVGNLKLEKLYPNFYKEGYNYRATPSYKLDYSKDFHSVVIVVFKGDNEMESVLINYDVKGNIIDSKVISYDEIAEGMSRIESRIELDKITINNIVELEEKNETIETFKVNNNGKITPIKSTEADNNSGAIDPVEEAILQLNINRLKVKDNLIVSKVQPHNPNETIVVIPEIATQEGEHFFELNTHIALVDNTTGQVIHKYFESNKTNGWTSDALQLREIKIDTAPYLITENTRAFGIRVYYLGSSKANPYTSETISLFVKSGDKLQAVVHNYEVISYGGEWDTDCLGKFIGEKKTLIISEEKTNSFFDIIVNNTITETTNFEDQNGDCDSKETISHKTSVLKYNTKIYKEELVANSLPTEEANNHNLTKNDAETLSYSEYSPKKLENIQINKFDVNHAYQLDSFKIVSGYSEDGQIIASDAKTDWGDKLLLLDSKNEILYKSQGFGDPYLFEPHFYKNNKSNKIIIICQLAFEYPLGGEAFILEKEKTKHIGTLDIEGYNQENDEEKYLTEIVEINEKSDRLEFTFKSDSLVLEPGSKDIIVKNNNIKYVYENNKLMLKRTVK